MKLGFIKYTHGLSLLRVTAILITVVYPRHALALGSRAQESQRIHCGGVPFSISSSEGGDAP